MASEKVIEQYLRKTVKKFGGFTNKGNATNCKGYPDRIIHLPGGIIGFLELKSKGRKPTRLQRYYLDLLSGLGFKAEYADTKEEVDKFLKELCDKI